MSGPGVYSVIASHDSVGAWQSLTVPSGTIAAHTDRVSVPGVMQEIAKSSRLHRDSSQ